jgi:hypothetical protein
MKRALGLAVSGTEVRLAHLISHNGQIRIDGLERAKLQTTLENQPADSDELKTDDAEGKDAFGEKDAANDSESRNNGQKPDGAHSGNLEILYRLLEKYTQKKVRIGFNIPLSMTTYQRPDLGATAIGTGNDGEPSLAQEAILAHDGSRVMMAYERHPPTMVLMRELNDFLRGNLFLALMDSTEVALANLARRSNECPAGKITAIVYVEDDFTRLIFMRGKDLFHVSSIIHENAASPDILEVIYRKLIYEQDEAGIPELASMLLAGKCSRINAAEFFASQFPSATVEYLSSNLAGAEPSSATQAGLFSEFAVPIALAWKTLEPKSPFFIPTNLIPQDLLDQQQVLKLNYHGFLLLALTGMVTFFFTWQIMNLSSEVRETRQKNLQLEMEIANNQETVDRVMTLDNQCQRLRKSLALVDSLGRGHDEFLAFLRKLNAGLGRVSNIWVDEIVTNKDGFSVRGSSMSRDAIPSLAEKLGNASLRQMTRSESERQKLFGFSLERHNAPDTAAASGQGFSTIDAARFAGNGKLILGKESVRPAASLPAPTAAALASGAARPENTRQNQVTTPVPDNRARQAATNGASSSQPAVRPASSSQPAAANRSTVNRPDLNTSRTPAMPGPISATPKSALATPPPKVETKAERFVDNEIRTRQSEERSSSFAGTRSTASAPPPVQKSTNGLTRRAAESPADPSSSPSKASGTAVASRAAEPPPAQTTPKTTQPEIYRGYTIEAATSYTKELAEQFASAYRKQGYDAAVELYLDERVNAQKYRVLIGAFATRPAAEEKAAQMASILMKDFRVVGLK